MSDSSHSLDLREMSAAALVVAAVEGRVTFAEVRAELRRREQAWRRPAVVTSFVERSAKEDD